MYNLVFNKCLFDKHKARFSEYLKDKPSKLEMPDPLNDQEFLDTLKEFEIDVKIVD